MLILSRDRNLRRYGAESLFNILQKSIFCKVLNLSCNSLGDDGAYWIAQLLEQNKYITKLDLSSNGIGNRGAFALANMLRVNSSLLSLNLRASYSAFAMLEDQIINEPGMLAISDALKKNNYIQHFDIRDHCANRNVLASWVQALQKNSSIVKFNGLSPQSYLSRNA